MALFGTIVVQPARTLDKRNWTEMSPNLEPSNLFPRLIS